MSTSRPGRPSGSEAQVDAILRQLYTIDYESEAERTMQEAPGYRLPYLGTMQISIMVSMGVEFA